MYDRNAVFIGMPKRKPHGMTGRANASKGREGWKRTQVKIDPHLKKWARLNNVNLTEVLNDALEALSDSDTQHK
jgi:hypothetical protein